MKVELNHLKCGIQRTEKERERERGAEDIPSSDFPTKCRSLSSPPYLPIGAASPSLQKNFIPGPRTRFSFTFWAATTGIDLNPVTFDGEREEENDSGIKKREEKKKKIG